MSKKGILIVVSGFSGAGKGTLMKELTKRYDHYALSVSATTREPRNCETDGVDYFFKTREEFLAMIEQDELIEHACYVNNYYGTPRKYVEAMLEEGKDVLLEIEIQGALLIKEQYPEALLIFVTPPDMIQLQERLTCRGTEDMETIRKRMVRAREEADGVELYDYIIINHILDECVIELHQMIQSQHHRTKENLPVIDRIKNELDEYLKGEL